MILSAFVATVLVAMAQGAPMMATMPSEASQSTVPRDTKSSHVPTRHANSPPHVVYHHTLQQTDRAVHIAPSDSMADREARLLARIEALHTGRTPSHRNVGNSQITQHDKGYRFAQTAAGRLANVRHLNHDGLPLSAEHGGDTFDDELFDPAAGAQQTSAVQVTTDQQVHRENLFQPVASAPQYPGTKVAQQQDALVEGVAEQVAERQKDAVAVAQSGRTEIARGCNVGCLWPLFSCCFS